MSFLLDTNVLSESAKPRPDGGVIDWLAVTEEDRLFLSVVSLAELRYGVERLSDGRKKFALNSWLTDDLPRRFENRLLFIDGETADQWGRIVAHTQAVGRPIGAMDAFLAATALRHGLTLATRNVTDFEAVGVAIFNPWSQSTEA